MPPGTPDSTDLRLRAEGLMPAHAADMPDGEARLARLAHELQVHQIELELQNEELRRSQAETEAALEHFADFYNFSPVGFVTLGRDGTISRVNLAGARQLGRERGYLIGWRFAAFVAEAGVPPFDEFLRRVFAGESGQLCELELLLDGRPSPRVQISATLSPDGTECRAVVVDISERQRAAELLRESSQFNAQVIANAKEGIVVYGPDLRYRVWNDFMESFTGMPSAAVLGRHPLEVFPFLKDSGVMASLESVLAGGGTTSIEFPFEVMQTGRSGWALDRNAPLRNERGEIIGVIGTVSDITQQKSTQESLNAAHRFTRSLIDSLQDGFSALDAAGVHQEVNPSLCRMTGFSREELIGTGVPHPYWPPEELAAIQAALDKVMNGKLGDIELTFMRKNGERFPVMLTPAVVRDEAGQPVRYTATVKDITKRRRREEKLRAAQQRLRDIIDATDGIVWEIDAQSLNSTFISQQAERLLGYPLDDWRQPGFWANHLHPEDRDRVLAEFSVCARLMKPFDIEYRFITQSGRTIWLHDLVTVVVKNGEARWLRGIAVDVTRRRLAEEKLTLLAENLEARVDQRTRELRRVSAELTMFEERERRLLAQDLHDNLGQLLAVIKIKLTSMAEDSAQTAVEQTLALVEQSDRVVRSITQQLSPPILRTLGLAPALEWLSDEMERVYGLRVHVDRGECAKCMTNEMQAILYRAARELLINVARHAGVKDASLTCLCEDGRMIIVASDAGRGFVPAEYLGEWTTHSSFGLRSIQERIVNLGGTMDVDSSPGNGTTVTVSVPR